MPIAGRPQKKPQGALAASRASGSVCDVRLARNLAQTLSANASARWILCPWLDRFPKDTGVWLSVLAAHDANEDLLEALPASKKRWLKVYAGVLAVDTLRPTAQLIRHFKSAGIYGVINFPSVSFIDGEAAKVFKGLSLGIEREIEFLQACSMEGLRIAGVTNSAEAAQRLVQIGVDFLISHGGPPTRDNPDPSQNAAILLENIAMVRNTPVVPMSRVRHRSRQ
jgi:predicted TIM-barrel enzyme